MRRHHSIYTVLDGRAKWDEFERLDALLGFVQFRQSHMGVFSRVAVTREVLRT